jgi:ion channel-forming bestrophin family protein
MIVGRAPRIRQSLNSAWRVLFILFLWDVIVTLLYFMVPFKAPALPLSLFGTALALFLGFRDNSAYQRWWEGRVLWGAMINASRSLARGIHAFLPDDDAGAQALKHAIVRRQIAFVNTLRCQLRRQDPAPEATRILGEDAVPLLARANPANAIHEGTSRLIAKAMRQGMIDTIQQSQLESVMVDISNAHGGMERLKNTPLPAQYRSFPSFFTRLFCVLLPIGLVETLGVATPIGSSIAGLMFLMGLQIGDDLVDPFNNSVHDVPISAICRTIEIDLLQANGEEAPKPLAPVDGVLW